MKTKLFRLLSSFLLMFAFGFTVQAQSISGTVTDENGVPLPGATVLVEGTQNGVSTDFDGNYSISASSGDTLVVSFVGYTTQSVVVGSSSTIDVSLQPDNALEEVVVNPKKLFDGIIGDINFKRSLERIYKNERLSRGVDERNSGDLVLEIDMKGKEYSSIGFHSLEGYRVLHNVSKKN